MGLDLLGRFVARSDRMREGIMSNDNYDAKTGLENWAEKHRGFVVAAVLVLGILGGVYMAASSDDSDDTVMESDSESTPPKTTSAMAPARDSAPRDRLPDESGPTARRVEAILRANAEAGKTGGGLLDPPFPSYGADRVVRWRVSFSGKDLHRHGCFAGTASSASTTIAICSASRAVFKELTKAYLDGGAGGKEYWMVGEVGWTRSDDGTVLPAIAVDRSPWPVD
jgi:hypothetical protein